MRYQEINEVFELRDGELWRKSLIDSSGSIQKERFVSNIVNHHTGYCQVRFKNRKSLYHRIVWILSNRSDIPSGFQIDHIDGNKVNNLPENLRLVSVRGNQQNQVRHREGRLVGARFNGGKGRWRAEIKVKRKRVHLGLFDTELEAHLAYCKAHEEYGFGKVLNGG